MKDKILVKVVIPLENSRTLNYDVSFEMLAIYPSDEKILELAKRICQSFNEAGYEAKVFKEVNTQVEL